MALNDVQNYIINTVKTLSNGQLPNYPDPADPSDLGSALTQAEINTLKKFIKEIQERFIPE
jgi:hypothetical protein